MSLNPNPEMTCAVVGMAGRFADAASLDTYWRGLLQGRHFGRTLTRNELIAAGVDQASMDHPRFVPVCAPLSSPFEFDPALFDLRIGEARWIDPQQRLFLEIAWQALEDAGALVQGKTRRIGVFAAGSPSEWRSSTEATETSDRVVTELGRMPDFLATRVAYLLDLHGPALTVSTACSSSLVALHLATTSLLTRECDLALAGGSALRYPPLRGHIYEPGGIYSSDGTCRPYDEKATGTFSGDGAGAVVLKRLVDAQHDGDLIYALVLGTAVNNDGHRKASFVAPSMQGQTNVAIEALAAAQIDPAQVSCIEGHGTGTRLGDPVEVAALANVWRRGSCARETLLGSVKSNVGHLDAASGIASFIKAALAFHHGIFPGTVWFEKPNEEIHLAETPFAVTAENRPVPSDSAILVHNLGLGGTNAGALLAGKPAAGPITVHHPVILPFSARSRSGVEKIWQEVQTCHEKEGNLAGMASTLQNARTRFPMRTAAVLGRSQKWMRLPVREGGEKAARTVFVAPGGGAWNPMNPGLLASIPSSTIPLAAAKAAVRHHAGVELEEINQASSAERCFAAIVAFSIAVGQTLQNFGIQPQLVTGISLGEITAAALAGVFDLDTAVLLAATRGRLFDGTSPGCAFAVDADAVTTSSLIEDFKGIAVAVNAGRGGCVVSGVPEVAKDAMAMLIKLGRHVHLLSLGGAPHSPSLSVIRDAFEATVASVPRIAPTIPVISSLDGLPLDERALAPEHWGEHLVQVNRWDLCLRQLSSEDLIIDLGPGRTLLTSLSANGLEGINMMPNDADRDTANETLASAIAAIWTKGAEVDWSSWGPSTIRGVAPTAPLERVPLPFGVIRNSTESQEFASLGLWDIQWTPCPLSPAPNPVTLTIQGQGEIAVSLRDEWAHHGPANVSGNSSDEVTLVSYGPGEELDQVLATLHAARGRVCLITLEGVALGGEVKVCPMAAAVRAFAMTVAQERSDIQIFGLDITLPTDWRRVIAEALNGKAPRWRALRSGRVFRPDMVRISDGTALSFSRGGVYALIGGLGKYGRHLTRAAGQAGASAIVCVTRELGSKDHIVAQLKEELAVHETSFIVQAADAALPGVLREIIDQIISVHGRLDGIIHLAAELRTKSAYGQLDEFAPHELRGAWEEQMRAKLGVAQALADATNGRDPGFVVLFSSNAAVLAGPALAFYAAANAALDAFASELRARGRPWTAIRWDGWRLEPTSAPSSLEAVALSSQEALVLFSLAVGSGLGAVSAARGDLKKRWHEWIDNPRALSETKEEDADRLTVNTAHEKWSDVERMLGEICMEIIGEPVMDRFIDLLRMGFHSLALMRMRLRIAERFNVELPLSLLLRRRTIESIARAVTAAVSRDLNEESMDG